MSAQVSLTINGRAVQVADGASVAAAVAQAGAVFRRSPTGEPRSALCGMGMCFECRVTIDGVTQRQACMLSARDGMQVQTDG